MKNRKGIVLAGGYGTRLYPVTKSLSKQLLPIYDKPMIYYSISILLLAKIRNILIISSPEHMNLYKQLLGDGSQWGINLEYVIQEKPNGLGQAFILGEKFIGNDNVSLILGDNLFYGNDLQAILEQACHNENEATIFAYRVSDPERFGVVEFDKKYQALSIEEKPKNPKSNYAVTGLYFYDNDVIDFAKKLKPSPRGELEITDINKKYLEMKKLSVSVLGSGFAWLDTGTPESLIEASYYVYTLEKRQGTKLLCPEEIAYKNNWINEDDILALIESGAGNYTEYLKNIIAGTRGRT